MTEHILVSLFGESNVNESHADALCVSGPKDGFNHQVVIFNVTNTVELIDIIHENEVQIPLVTYDDIRDGSESIIGDDYEFEILVMNILGSGGDDCEPYNPEPPPQDPPDMNCPGGTLNLFKNEEGEFEIQFIYKPSLIESVDKLSID